MIKKADIDDLEKLYSLVEDKFGVKYKDNVFTNWLVYKENNKIIGFINYDSIYEKIEIEYIYVMDEYRRLGIATKLLNKMIEELSDFDCITLEVDINNKDAINFYKKNNFIEASIREKYYGKDNAILMIRRR